MAEFIAKPNIDPVNTHGKKTYAIGPDEWDFRGLKTEHAHAAMQYELARESPELDDAIALLTAERRAEIEPLTEQAWEDWQPAWIPRERYWRFWDVFRACWWCGQFPKPWMALSEAQRALAAERCGARRGPLRVLTRVELSRIESMEEMFAKAMETLGHKQSDARITSQTQRYIIEIDWSFDDPLLKPVLLELLNRRPEGTRPRKRHTGKRASSPMHKFRQLAAWRLGTKARLRYKEASQFVERWMRQCPKDDPFDLLPSYKSPGAWKDAVDAGQRLVRRGG